jgi:hypothetical protein
VTAHAPQAGAIISYYTLLAREPPKIHGGTPRGRGGGLALRPLQLAGCSAGTMDNNLTLPARDDVLCAEQLAPLTLVGIT